MDKLRQGLEYLVALPFEEGIRHVNQSTPLDSLRPLGRDAL